MTPIRFRYLTYVVREPSIPVRPFAKIANVNSESARGDLLRCEAKKPSAPERQRASPILAMTGSNWRAQLTLEYRQGRLRTDCDLSSLTFRRVSRLWELDIAEPAPYPKVRRKLRLFRTTLCDPGGCRSL